VGPIERKLQIVMASTERGTKDLSWPKPYSTQGVHYRGM
jgi:hypothetical protein